MKSKNSVLLSLSLAVVLVTSLAVMTPADEHKCGMPGCNGTAKADVYTVVHGMKVMFCQSGCTPAFMKDADANLKKAMAEGRDIVKLASQTVCPVSGEKLMNKDNYVDVEGMRVYTCCPDCKPAVEKDPKKYVKVLYDRGETPDMICPNCGVVPADHVCPKAKKM